MRIKVLTTVLLAGLLSLHARAGFEQFNNPVGGMNAFDMGGGYQFSIVPFGLADLRSVTTDNRTFELLPNVNLYTDNPGDPVWRNNGGAGPDGGSIVEANTTYEITALTPDIDSVVFNFTVDAFSLDMGRYQLTGFIKVLDSVGGTYNTLTVQEFPITGTGTFPLTLGVGGLSGQLLQAGWTLRGQNANPSNNWGSATITATQLYAVSSDNTAPAPDPMQFTIDPYAVSSNAISMVASNAVDDNYPVEYLFTNTVNNTSSGWQSSSTWLDSGPSLPSSTNVVDKMNDPTFLDINANWNGYSGGSQTPSSFVSTSGGVATVTPGSAAEWDFYQEFTGVLNAGQTYDFSIVSSNSTLVGGSAVAFVKAFGPGYAWHGAEFQTVPLPMDGSATHISIPAQSGTTIYQVGVFSTGTSGGSYDVSMPSLTTTEIIPASSGLTPDTAYTYRVKARDTSPQTNETAWSSAVTATSTVTDVTAPTPDPMLFAVVPAAVSDTAISMTASNATDDAFGVEYLFTNTVNNTSSGWQSSPTWVNVGELALVNAGFESGTNGWSFNGDVTSSTGVTNLNGNASGFAGTGGGWSVVVQAITNITAAGFSGGDDVTFTVDARALAGLNNGGAILKMESWGGGSQLDTSGDVSISPTTNWNSFSMPYTIASGADEVRIVMGTVGASSTHLFDNAVVSKGVSLSPGTSYTYRVKARDTSPNANETAWSSPVSATTTGTAPVPPFNVQIAAITAGQSIFNWSGVAGQTYDVQYTTNLVTGPWMTDPSPGASGILSVGGSESATSTVNNASVFYRIIVQ